MSSRSLDRLKDAVLMLALATLLAGCPPKRTPALAGAAPGEGGDPNAADTTRQPQTEQIEGRDVQSIGNESASGSDISGGADFGEGGPLTDIHFELDSAQLSDAARATLEKHALWLQGQRATTVTVEGHCDERGTTEYNLALGEQRARAAREYLVGLGVDPSRLRVVSYGKERPIAMGNDESSHARNRRAHFNVR